MKIIAAVLVSAALALAAAVPSQASDQTRFEGLVRKYVPEYVEQFDAFTPKTACICEPQGLKAAGVLLVDAGFVNCLVPNFVDGSLKNFYSCTSYVVLGR